MERKSVGTKMAKPQIKELEEMARDAGMTKSEAVRQATHKWMDEQRDEPRRSPWMTMPTGFLYVGIAMTAIAVVTNAPYPTVAEVAIQGAVIAYATTAAMLLELRTRAVRRWVGRPIKWLRRLRGDPNGT